MDILYDETGREVGRSCLKNAEQEKAAAAAAAAAASAAALAATRKKEEEASKITLAKKEEKKKAVAAKAAAPVVANKVVTTKKKEKVAAAAATTVSEGSGFSWWPWLLLGLLLLGLLYFLRGCFGMAEDEIPTPMDVSSIVTPPIQQVTPTGVAAFSGATCACNSDCGVLDLPENGRAQIITRLGTNPEFGNAHGLTGPQFLGRLRNRYAIEPADKRFLDELFTCLGYENGFADATADMFSEVTLPNGKTGNMGYGSNHGTAYTTLNARDAKDLEAFKIEAKNGCDVHFMKTCGNHFFFCN